MKNPMIFHCLDHQVDRYGGNEAASIEAGREKTAAPLTMADFFADFQEV